MTLVDNSCEFNDKLKCNVFSDNLSKSISGCKIGDIIRFHRLKVAILEEEEDYFLFIFNFLKLAEFKGNTVAVAPNYW